MSADAVQFVLAALLVLGAAEVRQHVGERPAGIAEPAASDRNLEAADIEEAVNRAHPPKTPRGWITRRLSIPARARSVEPIDLGVGEQLAVAERNVNPDVAVRPAGLQQQHAMAPRRGQPIGENASGRAGADDDVVEVLCLRHQK